MATRRRQGKRPDKRDRYDRRHPDLGALDRLMRERAALAPLPPPRPLHKMATAATPETSAGNPPAAAPTKETTP